MSKEILNNVLSSKILPDEIINWLTADNEQNFNWTDGNQSSTKTEFVACFLNFLRDQFAVVQQAATNTNQTPSKEKPKIPATSIINKGIIKIDNSASSLHDSSRLNDSLDDSRPLEEKSALNVKNSTLPNENLISANFILKKSPEIRKQVFESNKSCDNVLGNKMQSPLASQPVIKKRVSLQSVTEKSTDLIENNPNLSKNSEGILNTSDFRQQKDSNLPSNVQVSDSVQTFFKTCPNVRNAETTLPNFNRIFSPGSDSFVTSAKDQSSSFNASFLSQNYSHNENSSNSSQTSENSVRSELHFPHSPLTLNESKNPISPLYCQSGIVTPKNSQKSFSKSSEKQSRTNNYFKHSTPEQNSNSSQKGAKSSSRQNLSLGDFITVDTRSSKKGSGKKNNQKTQLLRNNKDSETKPALIFSDENFPEMGQSFERRRRIKPTKLDVSGNKGNKENTVFGIVNRPATSNPHFSEIQSTDQASDKTSFETERVLLRLERQKKPDTSADNKADLDSIIKIVRAPRTPVKKVVIPSLTLVDKIDLLESLVQIYCTLIDNNLILNPMTEMYFILSLITTQYFIRKSPSKSDTTEFQGTGCSLKSKELKQEDLEQDLGCALLTEEENKEDLLAQNKGSSEDSALCLEENIEKLKQLTVDSKSPVPPQNPDKEDDSPEKKNGFKIDNLRLGTPHNCVFFSTRVLNQERHWLKFLDRATLKLLSENSHIAAFQPDLQVYLNELYQMKLNEVNRIKQHAFSTVDPNVSFQMDTDNRENFPSLIAFQSFRKQRDLFYEILKIWEENHTKSSWKFPVALSPKIKMLLTLHSDVINHCHIARLFKSQLLISCLHSGQQENVIDDESLSILKSLKDINPEKLTQLKERLVTPLSSKGTVPEPHFPGVQEFFKNFILYAFNPMFYAHLEDCLIHEILELNDAQFAGSDIEDTETMVDERTKQNFVICLSSLRLLGKFMGFLVSLPYRSSTSSLNEVVKAQVSLRNRIMPALNLQACLYEAITHGKLSLTIPWVVEYLSQLDIASLRLPYYKRLLEILYCIYRISKSSTIVASEQFMSQQTSILIKFSLGWLFELQNFPTDLYFSWQSSHTNEKLKTICHVENQSMDVSVVSNKNSINLDKLDIIDERVLYSCCPFLVEFKILLTGNSQSTGNKSNRHITPVSSQLPNATDSTNVKNLELQLEEAFFHGQPASTRKTVEFVSERVASTCVKYIFNSIFPIAREKCLNKLRKVVLEKYSKSLKDNPDSLKKHMMREVNKLSADISKEMKEQIEKEIPSMCKNRISQSIDSLLAEDTLACVKETCIQMAIRMSTDRIAQWIQSHIGESLFMKDMEVQISQIVKNDDPVTLDNAEIHNPIAACPTDVLDEMRACMWKFMDNKGESVTIEFISNILDQLYSCFTERADLIHGPENCLRTMSIDLFLFIVTYRKEFLTIEIQMKFIKFWKLVLKKVPESDFSLSKILSPRNIIILEKSNDNHVWIKCGQFIKLLLKEEVLSLEYLSDQCVALLRQDWPTETLQNLSKCLIIGIEDYRPSDEPAERIRYLLRWIAETYKDIDDLDH